MLKLARPLFFLLAVLVPLAGTQQTPRTNAVYTALPLVLDSKYGYPLVFVSVRGIKIPVSFDRPLPTRIRGNANARSPDQWSLGQNDGHPCGHAQP
jgi:hypothetical protein